MDGGEPQKSEIPGGVPGISLCKRMLKYLEENKPCCENYPTILYLRKLSVSGGKQGYF